MKYEIIHRPSFSLLEIELERGGEAVQAEAGGAMGAHEPDYKAGDQG